MEDYPGKTFDRMTDELHVIWTDSSPLSLDDHNGYWQEVMEAFRVHLDRERIRHGLWKDFPAGDQARQVKSKIDRVLRALELVEAGTIESEAASDSILEELDDIINYAVFAKRIVRGEVGPNV